MPLFSTFRIQQFLISWWGQIQKSGPKIWIVIEKKGWDLVRDWRIEIIRHRTYSNLYTPLFLNKPLHGTFVWLKLSCWGQEDLFQHSTGRREDMTALWFLKHSSRSFSKGSILWTYDCFWSMFLFCSDHRSFCFDPSLRPVLSLDRFSVVSWFSPGFSYLSPHVSVSHC